MYESKAYFYGTGRRKHSVSRVRLYPGTGKVTINNRDIDDYFGLDTLKVIVRQPFEVTNTAGQFDVVCTVSGGGVSGRRFCLRISRSVLRAAGRHGQNHHDNEQQSEHFLHFCFLLFSDMSICANYRRTLNSILV